MAAALVPPLTVIGAGLAFGDMSIARGSLILFATNLIAIIIVGVIVLMMLGFSPNAKKSYHQSVRRMVSILILLALLCIPLMQSFVNIGQDLRTKDIITSSTKNYLQTIDSRIRVTSSTYQLSPSVEQGIEIALQLQVPQSITLTQDQKLELTQLLAQALDESVNLQFVITPTVSVAKPTEYIPTTKELLDTAIIAYLKDSSDTITYLASNYVESADIYVLSLYAPSDEPITLRESEIMDYIHTLDTDPAEVIIDRRQPQIIPTPAEQTATDKLTSELRQIFSNYVGTAMVLENIVLDENIDLLQLNLTSYISSDETKSLLSGRQATLDSDLSLNAQVQYGERVRVE
ncbi:MAG: DUF389 domain-containing protein [Candidatus Peribacteria bacterium]|nr:MAG: DUF389 domain-containing protein [Candidatus Peribacteria bacterium]